jgi:hypothetical protein
MNGVHCLRKIRSAHPQRCLAGMIPRVIHGWISWRDFAVEIPDAGCGARQLIRCGEMRVTWNTSIY